MAPAIMLIALALCGLIGPTAAVEPNEWCYKDYPILDGLLCYKECKTGYLHQGGGPVCWAPCPKNTINMGLWCTKDTYTRGIGNTLSTCTAEQEKNGLLCYPTCDAGFYGVGPLCWANCKDGYTDDGALCRRNAHIYGKDVSDCPWYDKCGLCGGPWYNVCSRRRNCGGTCKSGYTDDGCTCRLDVHIYAKETRPRGVGETMGCQPGEEQNGLLCYPPCDTGYKGVGPVCWAECSGETIDTGTQCQKKAYGRGVGRVISCLEIPSLSSITNWTGLVEIFKQADNLENFVALGCTPLYYTVKFWIAIAETFNKCRTPSNWQTVSVSYSFGAAALVQATYEVGVAFNTYSKEGICFFGYCTGAKLDISVGADIAFGFWRGLDDVPGESRAWEIGLDVPMTELGATLVFVTTTSDSTLIGTQVAFGVGIGGPLPIEVGWGECETPAANTKKFTA